MSRTHGWSWIALLIGLVVGRPPGIDARDAAAAFTRVRGAGSEINGLIQQAYAKSATFRALVDDLQRSNVMVIVESGFCSSGRFRSCVVHVEGDVRMRSIRIVIDTRIAGDRLMATIGHELQHAAEIAHDPTVTNSRSVLRLYRKIANGACGEGRSDRCETEAALAVEAKVLNELRS
jgi:hypothetical protein